MSSDTGALIDSVGEVIRRFVVLTDAQRDGVALWVLHAYAIVAADTTPYLAITSPEKRSGKSRLLEILARLVPRELKAANASAAAMFRSLAESPPPTLLFDEVDAVFGRRPTPDQEALRGILNAGWRRGECVIRCVGEGSKHKPQRFEVFAPKAFAAIGELPETVADRCMPIRLRRKLPEETVDRARFKLMHAAAAPLLPALNEWAGSAIETLAEAAPSIPDRLDDRAADGAEPLLAIADLAGEPWAFRARESILTLYDQKPADDEGSVGVQLLRSILAAFNGEDRLASTELLRRLKDDAEARWGSFGKGDEGLNPRGLARLLRPYGIRSKSVRLEDGETPKGFMREQFEEAWKRYLSPETPVISATSATTALTSQEPALPDPPQTPFVADEKLPANPHSNAVVAGVADTVQVYLACRYPDHRGTDFVGESGKVICGTCHPRAAA